MNEREFAELSAARALNALSDADEQLFTTALRAHPEWAGIAEHDRETAASLAAAVEPIEPPPALRAELLARIAGDERESAPAAPPLRRRRLLFALAAAVVLIAGLGIGSAVVIPMLSTPASVVALQEIESSADAQQATVALDSGAQATAHWSASIGSAVLVTDGLEELDDGLTYELWFVRGDQPISAGVFEADAGATTALLDGDVQEGDVIAVTVEQEGGSPSGLPTTDPVIAIPTS